MTACIRSISAEQTIDLRLALLRQGLPRESAIFEGDDSNTSRHFGAFDAGRMVGVASVYRARFAEMPEEKDSWQLRGMATLPEVRGRGFARALLAQCLGHARGEGGHILWCNARLPAVGFYARHGLVRIGEEFDIPTAGPHVRMWIDLRKSAQFPRGGGDL